jgi:hypothetical protein
MQNENRIYRYNYFYSNCTTKARDIIEQSIQSKVSYEKREGYSPSHREMIHEMTQNNPWSAFGNDLLLGILADQPTDQRQQEFLPYHLMYDFDHASIYQDGKFRPLVKERRQPLPAGVQLVKSGFPLSPLACGIILVALALGLFFLQVRNKCIYRWWDALLMVTVGTFGIILFLMLFSQHPTVSLNLQILLLNPLPWFFLWKVVRRRPTRYWSITAILCVLFLIGGLFQHYAEGIWSLALCLLLQCYLHLKHRWA